MLALNRSLLNRKYTVINVLKALASIICMCNIHVTFFYQDYTKILYAIYKWNISSIHCKMRHRQLTTAREVDPLCLIFINFDIPALTLGLH
jgi:hypothetical protein